LDLTLDEQLRELAALRFTLKRHEVRYLSDRGARLKYPRIEDYHSKTAPPASGASKAAPSLTRINSRNTAQRVEKSQSRSTGGVYGQPDPDFAIGVSQLKRRYSVRTAEKRAQLA